MISYYSDNKVCIHKAITIGISEIISNDRYNIKETALTAWDNCLKTKTQRNPGKVTHTSNTHIKDNAWRQSNKLERC